MEIADLFAAAKSTLDRARTTINYCDSTKSARRSACACKPLNGSNCKDLANVVMVQPWSIIQIENLFFSLCLFSSD